MMATESGGGGEAELGEGASQGGAFRIGMSKISGETCGVGQEIFQLRKHLGHPGLEPEVKHGRKQFTSSSLWASVFLCVQWDNSLQN